MNVSATFALVCSLVLVTSGTVSNPTTQDPKEERMKLGSFSVSLAVKDIKASKEFYEKLDFEEVGGNLDQNWLILRRGIVKSCVLSRARRLVSVRR